MYSRFIGTCVSLGNGGAIRDMVDDARDITAATFRKNIGAEAYRELESQLGYTDIPGLSLAGDYAVSFAKSKYRGKPCYYCRWSAIEHVFTKD